MRLILNIVKENKRTFYKAIWNNFGNITLIIDDETDKMPRYFWDHLKSKDHARELKVIYLATKHILNLTLYEGAFKTCKGWWQFCRDREEIHIACFKLHTRYWERFIKKFGERARSNGGWPHLLNRTQVLKEFLAMGWIHRHDLDFIPTKVDGYCCYTHIADLWWPEVFEHHIDAINMPYHITGYSGTTTPKN